MANATDDFNRANNADLGTNWTVFTGVAPWSIVGNAVAPALASNCAEYWEPTGFTTNQYSQATITAISGNPGGDVGVGLLVRCAVGATTTYLCAVQTGTTVLGKVVATTYTQIATTTATGFAVSDLVRLEVEGTTLRCKKNGGTVLTQTDSSISTETRVGICYKPTLTDADLDDWEGGDLVAAGGLSVGSIGEPVVGGSTF
jgi:hypothetical protein